MVLGLIRKHYGLILILIFAAFLIFINLDDNYLWKDEAYTAEVGSNVLTFGYPRAWNGRNIMTGSAGNDFNSSFAIVNQGWLQFYIGALSIKFLGKSTFAARLPFALFGWLTIIVIWLLAKKIYEKKSLANLTALYCTCYVPFLLYVRQVRYYSLVFFFTALATLFLMYILDNDQYQVENSKKRVGLTARMMSLAVGLLFYANHLFGLVWCTASFFFMLLYHRKGIKKATISIFAGALLWLPWFLYANINSQIQSGYAISSNFSTRMIIILWKIQAYFFPFIPLIFMLVLNRIYLFLKNKPLPRVLADKSQFFLVLIVVNAIVVSAVEFFIINHYLLSVVIAVPFLLTELTAWLRKNSKGLALVIVFFIITSNILNMLPYFVLKRELDLNKAKGSISSYMSYNEQLPTVYNLIASPVTEGDASLGPLKNFLDSMGVRWYLYEYFQELSGEYDSPNKEIVRILQEKSVPGETVLIQGIEEEPVMFYTNLRVVNNLSPKIRPWNNYYDQYPNLKYSYLTYVPDEEIDWIITSKGDRPLVFDDPQYLEKHMEYFTVIESETMDIPLSNSADLDYHKFKTVQDGEKFYILHRKRGGDL